MSTKALVLRPWGLLLGAALVIFATAVALSILQPTVNNVSGTYI